MKNILINGANSGIAQAFARQYAQQNASFFLLARDQSKLESAKQDLIARGAAQVFTLVVDMANRQDYPSIIEQACNALGSIDIALISQGIMREQEALQNDVNLVRENYQVNLISAVEQASALGNYFEQRKQGSLLIISSVAGDRGRQSNYVYGSAKAALSVFADGLRNRLFKHGVTVVTVKPGFVDTPMTADIEKGGPLWATPEKIASDMVNAVDKGGCVLYTPWFWRYILLIIQHIPDFIFKKLSL